MYSVSSKTAPTSRNTIFIDILFALVAVFVLNLFPIKASAQTLYPSCAVTPSADYLSRANTFLATKSQLAVPQIDFATAQYNHAIMYRRSADTTTYMFSIGQPNVQFTIAPTTEPNLYFSISNKHTSAAGYWKLYMDSSGNFINGATETTSTYFSNMAANAGQNIGAINCVKAQKNVINTTTYALRNEFPFSSTAWAGTTYDATPCQYDNTIPSTDPTCVSPATEPPPSTSSDGITEPQFKQALHDYGIKASALAVTGILSLYIIGLFRYRGY